MGICVIGICKQLYMSWICPISCTENGNKPVDLGIFWGTLTPTPCVHWAFGHFLIQRVHEGTINPWVSICFNTELFKCSNSSRMILRDLISGNPHLGTKNHYLRNQINGNQAKLDGVWDIPLAA